MTEVQTRFFIVDNNGELGYVDRTGYTHVVCGLTTIVFCGLIYTAPVGQIQIKEDNNVPQSLNSDKIIPEPETTEGLEESLPRDRIDFACVALVVGFVSIGIYILMMGITYLIGQMIG